MYKSSRFEFSLLTIKFCLLFIHTIVCQSVWAQDVPKTKEPYVAVIVDTSISMKEEGMDPERAFLLVSRLLSDVVPGQLTFIRLVDLTNDQKLLPHKNLNKTGPCKEDPLKTCTQVENTADWMQLARDQKYGALKRPQRGSRAFKQSLDGHLEQRAHNSFFRLAFASAGAVLGTSKTSESQHGKHDKYLIWLSDGRVNSPESVIQEIRALQARNVNVKAVVFGNGDPAIAKRAKIPVTRSQGPADLMKAFADIMREIIRAPYAIDGQVRNSPSFTMLLEVREAWVVVYGNSSLGQVTLKDGHGQTYVADYAEDALPAAGAYKVAYIPEPAAGQWTISAVGGGPATAYAVVQNSSLYPFLLSPQEALADTEVVLEAIIKSSISDNPVHNPEIIGQVEYKAVVGGHTVSLNDNGVDGDRLAGDSVYSATVKFEDTGEQIVQLQLVNEFTTKNRPYKVNVSGFFEYTGGAFFVDFGHLDVSQSSCETVFLSTVKMKGRVPLEPVFSQSLPAQHSLRIESSQTTGTDKQVIVSPNDNLKLCLDVGPRAPSSSLVQEPLLLLRVKGSSSETKQLLFELSWEVQGLTFLQRWLWLIVLIFFVVVIIAVILGFVLPARFPSSLHIALGADRKDLEEYVPMQLNQWKGVRSGFYRNARAFVHDDFRVSGKNFGAAVKITAEKNCIKIVPLGGRTIYCMNFLGNWKKQEDEQPYRSGDEVRIGDSGPYFRLIDK